jgi:anti-sigma factor RsiW
VRATDDDMVCKDFVELVTEYLDGAMTPPERARFETHLAECPYCTEFLAQMRAVANALGGLRDSV